MPDLKFEKITSDKAAIGSCCGERSDLFPLPATPQRTCGSMGKKDLPPWAIGIVPTAAGTVLKVSSITDVLEVRYPTGYPPPALPPGVTSGYFEVVTRESA